jgi:hypothetical protein
MKRKIINIASMASLVLLIASVAAWVHSIGQVGAISWNGPEYTFKLDSIDGVLGVQFTLDSGLRSPLPDTNRLYGTFYWSSQIESGRDRASFFTPSFNQWGFGFHPLKTLGRPNGWWRFGGRRLWIVYFPFWLLLFLYSPLPLLSSFRFFRQQRRRRLGCCLICGYDLRASKDNCPECGSPIPVSGAPVVQ